MLPTTNAKNPNEELSQDQTNLAIQPQAPPTMEAYQKAIRDLTHANIRLRQLDKAKDEFISIASHELRNPMSIIKGNISMILAGDAGDITHEVRDILTDVILAVERQIRLVNELLDISRIEAGEIHFQLHPTIYIDQVAKLLAISLKGVAKNQNVEIEVEAGDQPIAPIQADQDKVSQVLINLVTNALKFTKQGNIRISFKQKGEYVITCVTDSGIGISQEQQDLLFRKFSKISSSVGTLSAGSGLGLYISKKYIERQGGNIWLDSSEPGKGSTFCFSLPISGSVRAKEVEREIKSLQTVKEAPYGKSVIGRR
jgi:signal transduction histidine kinase